MPDAPIDRARPARARGLRRAASGLALLVAVALASGCDRNVEPYVPGEEPERPDLSRIFPEGAKQAAEAVPALPPAPAPAPSRGVAAGGAPFEGTVRLGEGLSGAPGATLFIIARRGAGGPPLAVKRIVDPAFPLAFQIGPEDRMIEGMPFTGPLQVTARLDADGNATSRTPGDLQGAAAGPVQPGDAGVEIVLDQSL